jgi:hypothetical protein
MTCSEPSVSGRLSAFQKLMYQWSELHPYNAVHTYKIAGPVDLGRLQESILETYAFNNLGFAEVDGDRRGYRLQLATTPTIEVLEGGPEPTASLSAHVTRELNRPFGRPGCQPLRFAVIQAGPRVHYLATTYDHWVADSVGARLILRHILGRYLDLKIPENRQPLDLYPGTYREVFSRHLGPVHLAGAVLRSVSRWLGSRSAALPAYSSVSQMAVGYEVHQTASGTPARLLEFAHEHGATVHDVILAALARALAPHLPRRASRGGRGKLSLGTIVDTRPDSEQDLAQSLGTYLAYFLVRCRPDKHIGLGELTERIAGVTRPIKAKRRFLDSAVSMKFMSALWPLVKDSTKPHFARKALPLTAGVSNLVLRDAWLSRQGSSRILEYMRGVSTGPIMPLVLSPTTFDGQLNVGVTYRVTAFTRGKIDGILSSFLEQIENPRGTFRSRSPVARGFFPASERRQGIPACTAMGADVRQAR